MVTEEHYVLNNNILSFCQQFCRCTFAATNVVFAAEISSTVEGMIFPPQKVAPWSQFQKIGFL
uniref:Uncharacterized protein n=1 Tax=Romanomermis culicivorax TaxID=13658 RepID=A0A915IKT5_ROMCU